MRFRIFFSLFLFHAVLLGATQPSPIYEFNVSKYLLGTHVRIIAFGNKLNQGYDVLYQSFKEIERIEKLFTRFAEDSALSKLNALAEKENVRPETEVYELIRRSLDYAHHSDGYFDITTAPLLEFWGFFQETIPRSKWPKDSELTDILKSVGYQHLQLKDGTISFSKKGMKLDLGAFAKGYAVDRAAKVLKDNLIVNFMINAGGDIYVHGKNQDKDWSIGIKNPDTKSQKTIIRTLSLKNQAIATSGDYERFYKLSEKTIHHLIDPKTGLPGHRCKSASVIASSTEVADAYATSAFLICDIEKIGNTYDTLLVSSEGVIEMNEKMRKRLQP